MEKIRGIHHISAMVGDLENVLQFYREILKLRLVKQTVNFDDRTGYHLYFGSQSAPLSSLMTFFPQQNKTGIKGTGQVGKIAFKIPTNQLDYWKNRLKSFGIKYKEGMWSQFKALYISDYDQLELALVASAEVSNIADIQGFHGLSIYSSHPRASKEFLETKMGFIAVKEDENYHYLAISGDKQEELLIEKEFLEAGAWGAGTVHHVAWSLTDEKEERDWRKYLIKNGRDVTILRDRKYFKSIYFREPGQVIFEMATQVPGLTVDETKESLGKSLQLPQKYESRRKEIENRLPRLN
ncbi:VOC family protein [Streptococcus thoraltensis]